VPGTNGGGGFTGQAPLGGGGVREDHDDLPPAVACGKVGGALPWATMQELRQGWIPQKFRELRGAAGIGGFCGGRTR